MLLSSGCEDIIAEALTVDSLPSVLQWSSKPHGSVWVHRQAVQFLREEFSQLVQPCHLPVLYELSRDYLVDAVSSDFLQVGPAATSETGVLNFNRGHGRRIMILNGCLLSSVYFNIQGLVQ